MLLCVSVGVVSVFSAKADDNGAYSGYAPYSIYGVGDLFNGGSAYNQTMGGVGIASRNNRFINSLNPAAVRGIHWHLCPISLSIRIISYSSKARLVQLITYLT